MTPRFLIFVACCLLGIAEAAAQPASTWFLAEGASNATFDQDILVGNPSANALTITVELFPAPDAQFASPNPVSFPLPATARLTVNLKQWFPGLNGAASARVSAVVKNTSTPADIVVERSMFFPQGSAPYAGGSGASGSRAPAKRWILAEGAGGVFSTFVLIVNPGTTAAKTTVRYLRGDGLVITRSVTVPAASRATLWPTAHEADLIGKEFSTVIESDQPVVAERAMYFDDFRSGHAELGITTPRTTWYFAEGFTGGNATIAFETFLLIGNDNTDPVTVTATYYLDSGAPITETYTVGPRSRFNIWTDQAKDGSGNLLLPATAFSVKLESTLPIVAERAVYWGTPSSADPTTPILPWKEGHVVAGIEGPETRWGFAEGRQGPDASGAQFDSFFLVVNPNPTDIQVRATFVTEDGSGIAVTVPVPANTRFNIWPVMQGNPALDADFALLDGRRFAAFLESVGGNPLPFVAERAMYWNNFTGGHANAGTPWTGADPIAAPAVKPATAVTRMTPGSGRLSGGTVVTIEGRGFGPDSEVDFGGVRVLPVAVRGSAVTFVVPAGTSATGYGNAGPVPVAVRTRGLTLPAPNPFTRYFSVLAFGDSITWGTSNIVIGGIKHEQNAQRPYPLGLRNLLRQQGQFGEYALVTNAGWPGEQVTRGDGVTPGGEVRQQRCITGQSNCFYPQAGNPADFFTPFDAIIMLEGVNDLNASPPVMPSRIRDSLRRMTEVAQAAGLKVVLTRFDSYGIDERTDQPAVDPEANALLGNLVYDLAIEKQTLRERFDFIDMSNDGLHPNQIGYDRMADIAFRKIRDAFPRCPNGAATCP